MFRKTLPKLPLQIFPHNNEIRNGKVDEDDWVRAYASRDQWAPLDWAEYNMDIPIPLGEINLSTTERLRIKDKYGMMPFRVLVARMKEAYSKIGGEYDWYWERRLWKYSWAVYCWRNTEVWRRPALYIKLAYALAFQRYTQLMSGYTFHQPNATRKNIQRKQQQVRSDCGLPTTYSMYNYRYKFTSIRKN